jgi:hypothetical protein
MNIVENAQERRATARDRANRSPMGREANARNGTVLDAVRAFGVTVGPSALFDLFLAGSAAATARWLLVPPRSRLGKRLRPLASFGTALAVAYPTIIRRWMLRWGATTEELREPLPGDALVPRPAVSSTRAITVTAPVEAVWPWLAQVGQDRGGFYSYGWLENLAGCRMRNADRVHPEWQRREVGEVVKLHPATGCKVASFEPNRALVLEGWGAFVVEPLDAERTRVILRSRTPGGWPAVLQVLLIELPHFIMERKMLLGIKERAERAYASASSPTLAPSGAASPEARV